MRITFDEVNLYGEKSVKCQCCGKRIKRRRKFYQTLNPWNKGPDGLPKTRDDIYAELWQERDAWLQAPETCHKCQQNGGANHQCCKCGGVGSRRSTAGRWFCDRCVEALPDALPLTLEMVERALDEAAKEEFEFGDGDFSIPRLQRRLRDRLRQQMGVKDE